MNAIQEARHLDVMQEADKVTIDYQRAVSADVVLHYRISELVLRLRATFRRCGRVVAADDRALIVVCGASARETLSQSLVRADKTIDELAHRPLTPRMVAEILRITPKERLRWAKDGRLAHCGPVVVKAGKAVTISTYAADAVRKLASDPSQIARWRSADAATGSPVTDDKSSQQ